MDKWLLPAHLKLDLKPLERTKLHKGWSCLLYQSKPGHLLCKEGEMT